MIFRFAVGDAEWIDLENPSQDELHSTLQNLNIGGRIVEELLSPSPLPTVLSEAHAVLAVLHMPSASVVDGKPTEQEIDIVVGAHYVLTVRYEVIVPLHELRKLLEAGVLEVNVKSANNGSILEIVFNHLYDSIRSEVAHISKRLERVEREMFMDNERQSVKNISLLARELLHLEASIAASKDVLNLFLDEVVRRDLGGSAFEIHRERIRGHFTRTAHGISTLRGIATELRETNVSLLTATQNNVIKTIAVLSFVILSLDLIATVFNI